MKLRELGTTSYVILLLAGFLFYQGTTAQDIKDKQGDIRDYYSAVKVKVVKLKKEYMKEFNKCKLDNKFKNTAKCQLIKDNHDQIVSLWEKLQKLDKKLKDADEKATEVRKALSTLEKVQSIIKGVMDK